MGLGDVLEVEETGSPVRLNAKTTIFTDALTLSNLPTTPCMRVVPTTTGYGFVKDVARRRNADNDSWLSDGMARHLHIDDTDLDGGPFSEVLFGNMGQLIDINLMHINKNYLSQVVSGTGAQITDNVTQTTPSNIHFETGSARGGLARFFKMGILPYFGSRSKYQVGYEISAATNMLFRLGIGAEQVDVSNNALRKYGIEGCSSAPEGTVVLVFSADNVTRSTQASTDNIVESGGNSYVVQHSPSLNIKMIKGALTHVTSKTSNIPSSGSITGVSGDDFAVIKGGIKSTIVSENKNMQIYGQRFIGYVSDTRWAQVLWQ